MNFDQALDYLLRLGHETLVMKFGLENTRQLLDALDQPEKQFPKVQIAGTNGKGSTAVMLDSICRAAGINTGLYTSPHLQSITERIRINGNDISENSFARLTTMVSETAYRLVEADNLASLPTFFEHVTAVALVAFREEHVKLGILETGLGGRLDATTAACAEIVAITPIALDHQEYLGPTLSEIAGEKAAVIRPGVIAIVAPQPQVAMDVIIERCASCHVKPTLIEHDLHLIGRDQLGRMRVTFKTSEDVYENVRLNLPGRHQTINASVAIGIAEALITRGFEIPHDVIVAGLETAEHPGRLEWCTGVPSFLFDGAHNQAGAIALREYLDEFVDAPITLVFGAMRDKDLTEMAATLFPAATRIILTEINNPRSASRESLAELIRHEPYASRATVCGNSSEALNAAIEHAHPDGLVCVTGSLFLVGEVKAMLRHEKHATYTA